MTPLEALAALGDGEHTALEVAGRMGIAYNDRAHWKEVRKALVEAADRGECVKTRNPTMGVRFTVSAPEPKAKAGRPPVRRVRLLRSMADGPSPVSGMDRMTLKRCSEAGLCLVEGGYATVTDAGRDYLRRWEALP